jgi:hypothetical protein
MRSCRTLIMMMSFAGIGFVGVAVRVLAQSEPEPACSGDLNGDGCVDQADLGILLAHWGEGC